MFLIKVTGKFNWCVLLLKRFSKLFPILSSHLSPVSLSHLCVSVHGGWSSWFGWSHCSATCIAKLDGDVIVPSRVRHRSCSNPTPSENTSPPGNSCPGDALQVQHCSELPNCAGERGTNSCCDPKKVKIIKLSELLLAVSAEDGSWGAWSPFRPCSVSCGVGLQLSERKCDSPTPRYGGKVCEGPSTQSKICESPCPGNTHTHTLTNTWSLGLQHIQ